MEDEGRGDRPSSPPVWRFVTCFRHAFLKPRRCCNVFLNNDLQDTLKSRYQKRNAFYTLGSVIPPFAFEVPCGHSVASMYGLAIQSLSRRQRRQSIATTSVEIHCLL